MGRTTGVIAMLCVAVSVVRLAAADDQADARAVVAKAIKAVGGAQKLEKFKAQTWREVGTYYGMGDGLPYTGNYAVQWPNQFRMEIEGVFVIVLNGDKGWMGQNNEIREMTEQELNQQKGERYFGWVTTLAPLKDKAFKLSVVGDAKVDDRPAIGVRVSREKHRDVNLYFDKESGLLVKSESQTNSPEQEYKEVPQEVFYRDYKEIGGIKFPMKITLKRDGKLFVEAENHDMKPMENLDDSVFGKP